MKCLADSCVWIDFSQGKNTKEVIYFEEMLKNKLLYTVGLVKAEIIPFIKDTKIQNKVEDLFDVVSYLFDYVNVWNEVILHQKKLLKKGLVGSVPDLLLASFSIHYNVPLLTTDHYFFSIAKIIELEVISL